MKRRTSCQTGVFHSCRILTKAAFFWRPSPSAPASSCKSLRKILSVIFPFPCICTRACSGRRKNFFQFSHRNVLTLSANCVILSYVTFRFYMLIVLFRFRCTTKTNQEYADVAQWQSISLVMRRLWVRFPPSAPRRSKLYIVCSDFFQKVRAHSFRCSSFSSRKRSAGLRLDEMGLWIGTSFSST